MVCMKWTSGSDQNVSNSCQNGGTDATGQLMVCTLKDFKVWRFCNHFAAAKHPSKWRFGCEMEDLQGVEVSQPFRSCETGVRACEMGLVCQGDSSQLQKFSQRRKGGCKTISQREAIFAAAHFCCEISQPMLSSCFLSSS